jgi:hypothetical protein
MQRFYRFVTSASSAGELGARHRSQICRGLEQRFARLPFHATAKNRDGGGRRPLLMARLVHRRIINAPPVFSPGTSNYQSGAIESIGRQCSSGLFPGIDDFTADASTNSPAHRSQVSARRPRSRHSRRLYGSRPMIIGDNENSGLSDEMVDLILIQKATPRNRILKITL